jgi:peptidoglycan/xylan/chitin deacetylase (PgdA/CDA1 family)
VRGGLLRAAGRLVQSGAVILMYHSIVEDPRETANTIGSSQSRAAFEAHMRTLAERFSPVTIEQIAQFAKEGRPLPARPVATTFDDGFADNYEVALPILARYGIPAAFYIMVNAVETGIPPWYCRLNFAFSTTTRREWNDPEQNRTCKIETVQERKAALDRAWEIGAKKVGNGQDEFVRHTEELLEVEPPGFGLMLTWDKVSALKEAGHIVGAHTLSHPNLAHVSQEDARSEIMGSRQQLEKATGGPIHHFSYPHPSLNPQWSARTLQITREAGFRSAVLTTRGPVRRGDEPLALKRIYAASDLDQWIWNLECTFLGRSI